MNTLVKPQSQLVLGHTSLSRLRRAGTTNEGQILTDSEVTDQNSDPRADFESVTIPDTGLIDADEGYENEVGRPESGMNYPPPKLSQR